MKNNKYPRLIYCCFLFTITIFIVGCEQVQKVTDVITQPTAREVYERHFKKTDSLYLQWNNAFEKAKKDSLQILLPYSESGIFPGILEDSTEGNLNVYSYNIQLREGERITVEVEKAVDSALVFIDFFKMENDSITSKKPLKSAENGMCELTKEISKSGYYKIIVQPQLNVKSSFILKIYAQPMYGFPVSGHGNKAIQSFWADPRDSGSRSHEGVDIFAPKGTPLLAVTNGIIGFTGDKGLGGKQVWLQDGIFGKSIYYAHLDSIAVSTGKRVKLGDTLGFVGNSGNARTTEPHLHFGIYKSGAGPVNPLPYIKITEIQTVESNINSIQGIVSQKNVPLQKAPIPGFDKFSTLKKNDTLFILGKSENWFHVQSPSGLKGFVEDRQLKVIISN